MKLGSLFFGDGFDWIQQEQIDAIEESAIKASIQNRVQQSAMEKVNRETAQRLYELEQNNALLGMIVLQLMKHLAGKDRQAIEKLTDEIRDAISNPQSPAPLDLAFLRKALELPPSKKPSLTPVKPVARRPSPPKP